MHRFDVTTTKTTKSTNAIKLQSICIDLTSKRSKMLSYVAKHSELRKTTKVIKWQWITSIWRQNDQNFWIRSQNYKSTQMTMNCIDLTSKWSKMFSYIPKHSKLRKTTKIIIILQWIASMWHQNDLKCSITSQNIQNNAKLRTWSNHKELHDVKTIKNVEIRSKTLKTTHNYESDQITMNCIDLTSKWSKMFSYVAKHSKLCKTTKVIKSQWIASIWHQNDQNFWIRSQNYKSEQIIDLTSKRSKLLS